MPEIPWRPDVSIEDHAGESAGVRLELAFERLLTDLTAAFVNLPPDSVDAEINRGLREIVEFVNVDRTTLMEFSADGSQLRQVHGYARPGIGPAPKCA